MNGNKNRDFGDDSFWNIDRRSLANDADKKTAALPIKNSSTHAVDIDVPEGKAVGTPSPFKDARLNIKAHTSEIKAGLADTADPTSAAGLPTETDRQDTSKTAATVTNASTSRGDSGTIFRYIPPHRPKNKECTPIFSYTPNNILIKSIKVFGEENGEMFNRDGIFFRERSALLHKTGKPCQSAGFFSVSPRYTQMTSKQLGWYLWWRENARHGEYLPTDISYITLYIYELITAEKDEDIAGGLVTLCDLWNHYYVKDRMIMFRLPDIIADYCMLHGLDTPIEMLGGSLRDIIALSSFNEFYLGFCKENRGVYARILPEVLSVYNYRKSKFYNEETRELFDIHIKGATEKLFTDEEAYTALSSFSRGEFNCNVFEKKPFSYIHMLRKSSLRMEITYYPTTELQEIITNTVRYAENHIRSRMGVKTSLNILALDAGVKRSVDRYMNEHLPAKQDMRRKENHPMKAERREEYEKLYDLPEHDISIEEAEMIEQSSWDTTKILIEAFGDTTEKEYGSEGGVIGNAEATVDTKINGETNSEVNCKSDSEVDMAGDIAAEFDLDNGLLKDFYSKLGKKADFIVVCRNGDRAAQKKCALSFGLTVDGIADEVNEISYEILGDILLEEQDGKYTVIDDYLQML